MKLSRKVYDALINTAPSPVDSSMPALGEFHSWCGKGHRWRHAILPTLKQYAKRCEKITELGTYDWNSTWAFIDADSVKKLRCYDVAQPAAFNRANGGYEDVVGACKENGIDFKFLQKSSLCAPCEETDLLFVDTEHTYEQVKKELELHAPLAKKYILFHDIVKYGEVDLFGETPSINLAIEEFLQNSEGKKWKKIETVDTVAGEWPKEGEAAHTGFAFGLLVIEKF